MHVGTQCGIEVEDVTVPCAALVALAVDALAGEEDAAGLGAGDDEGGRLVQVIVDGLGGGDLGDVQALVNSIDVPRHLEHLGGAGGVLVGVYEDAVGVDVIAEELVGARLEGGGPDVVAVRVVVEPDAKDPRGHGARYQRLEVLDLGLRGEQELVAALGVDAVHGRLDVEIAAHVLEVDGVVRRRFRGIDRRGADLGGAGIVVVHLDDIVPAGSQVSVHVTGEPAHVHVQRFTSSPRKVLARAGEHRPTRCVEGYCEAGVATVGVERIPAARGRRGCLGTAALVEVHRDDGDIGVHGSGDGTGQVGGGLPVPVGGNSVPAGAVRGGGGLEIEGGRAGGVEVHGDVGAAGLACGGRGRA